MGATRAAAASMVRPGGVVHVGLQDNEQGLDGWHYRQIAFRCYCYRDDDFAEALALTSGKVSGGLGRSSPA